MKYDTAFVIECGEHTYVARTLPKYGPITTKSLATARLFVTQSGANKTIKKLLEDGNHGQQLRSTGWNITPIVLREGLPGWEE